MATAAVLAALELLMERDRITVDELAERASISRSAAHRLLRDLAAEGHAVLGAGGRGYSAGTRLVAMTRIPALAASTRFRLRPILQTLRERTRESVHTAVLAGDHVLVVDGRRSAFPVDIGLRVGMTAPANTMAAGKLLLAAMTDAAVVSLLPDPLPQRAPASIASMSVLLADLARVRRTGWSSAVQESEPGVTSIAVPLDGRSRSARIALVVSVPFERGGRARRTELAHAALDVVEEFSDRSIVQPWSFRDRARR